MASIVAFNGSPRKDGHCSRLLDELAHGVTSKGGTVKVYDMNDPGIRGCQGCFHCRTHPECAVKDAFTPAYSDIQQASTIVFASPIYFGNITGQAKICLDRLFPALDGEDFRPRWPGKKAVAIFAQGDGNTERFQPAINSVIGFLSTFGWRVEETLLSADASSLGHAIPGELVRRAYVTGQKLAE